MSDFGNPAFGPNGFGKSRRDFLFLLLSKACFMSGIGNLAFGPNGFGNRGETFSLSFGLKPIDGKQAVTPTLVGAQTQLAYGSNRVSSSVAKPKGVVSGNRVNLWAFFLRSGNDIDVSTIPAGFGTPLQQVDGHGPGAYYSFRLYSKITGSSEPTDYVFKHNSCNTALICNAWSDADYISEPIVKSYSGSGIYPGDAFPGFVSPQDHLSLVGVYHNWSGNDPNDPVGMTSLGFNGLMKAWRREVSEGPNASISFNGRNDPSGPFNVFAILIGSSAPISVVPDRNNWPSATNTGASGTLAPSGSIATSAGGQVIENLEITGSILIDHPNVIVRNCRINMADAYVGVENRVGHAGLLVEDCTIFTGGQGLPGASGLSIGDGDIVRRCNISGVENGMFFGGNGAQILGNYIHDLGSTAVDPHIDGLQCTGNCSNVLIDGNFIDSYDTSCIIMQNEFGGYSGTVTITNNWLQGPVSYTIYLRGDKGGGTWGAAATVTGNVVGPPAYGYLDAYMGPTSLTWTENIGPNGSSVD